MVRRSGPGHRLDTDQERLRQVVFDCVEELLGALRTPGFELATCRVVSHLTTANGRPIQYGGILVRPAKDNYGQDGGILQTIDKSIPGTTAVESPDDHLDYAYPAAIVEVRTGVTGFVSPVVERLTEQIAEFVGAVRLLTGGTLASGAQIQGSTSWTGRTPPYSFDFRPPGWGKHPNPPRNQTGRNPRRTHQAPGGNAPRDSGEQGRSHRFFFGFGICHVQPLPSTRTMVRSAR